VDAYGGYHRLSKPDRTGGKPLNLAFCWSHGRRKLIEAKPKAGSPIVDEALVRIAALYKIEGKRSPRPIDVFSLGRLTLFGMVRLCARQGVPGELISEGVATA
jgi:hypothetical protein